MAPLSSLAAVAALMATALAAPATSNATTATAATTPNMNIAFQIAQVSSGETFLNGPEEIVRTYAKFGKVAPASVRNAAIAVQSGSVHARPESYDSAYLCPVKIGTPPTTVMLDFDTGSSDLWTFSSYLDQSTIKGHSFYTPSKSSTSQRKQGQTWKIGYADGSGAEGIVFADKVVVGGVTATAQSVEAATSISSSFVNNNREDGLLGLGWPKINTCSPNACQPFVQNVGHSLKKQLFTSTLKHKAPGSYDFGFIDHSKYNGSITYTNIRTSRGYWDFTADGYCVGSKHYSTSINAIADTGTTLAYLPNAVLQRYYSKIRGAKNSPSYGGWVFPCNANLPNFAIKVNGATFTIPGSYINFAPVSSSTCFGGLQSSDGIGFSILGDMFLKSVFVVWDVQNTRIGFASQA